MMNYKNYGIQYVNLKRNGNNVKHIKADSNKYMIVKDGFLIEKIEKQNVNTNLNNKMNCIILAKKIILKISGNT